MIYRVINREISAETIAKIPNIAIPSRIYTGPAKLIKNNTTAPTNNSPPQIYSVRYALRDLRNLYNTFSSFSELILYYKVKNLYIFNALNYNILYLNALNIYDGTILWINKCRQCIVYAKNNSMPELPEVETVVRQLQSKILNKTITSIKSYDSLVVDPKLKTLQNQTITNITRRAKYILVTLNNHNTILIHLRMTGHFYYLSTKTDTTQPYQKYRAAQFHFTDNTSLTFNAIRRFERLQLLTKNQLNFTLSKLGPEPLDPSFTSQKFHLLLKQAPSSIIKTKLLDQTFIAGIGNIYAQEALYHSKIHPTKKIKDIPKSKLTLLHHAIQTTLQQSIDRGGTTVNNYAHLDGKGDFQDLLAVYQKDHCPKKHPLSHLTQNGRSTYYCPVCQK